MTDDVAGQQPFSASLSYVNASDPHHPDTMRIQVVVPHSDGLIPIMSTQPLHGMRHVERASRPIVHITGVQISIRQLVSSVKKTTLGGLLYLTNSPKPSDKNPLSGCIDIWTRPDVYGISKHGTP